MKFSERIKTSLRNSTVKHVIYLGIEVYFFLIFVFILGGIIWSSVELAKRGDIGAAVFAVLVIGGFSILLIKGAVWTFRYSVRRMKSNGLDKYLKTLEPFGNPKELLDAVENLPSRDFKGMDLRFDDQYLAFARHRDIFIRKMDQIRYFWDYGTEKTLDERNVVIIFSRGEPLLFKVKSSEYADQVISELYAKSAFGKWIQKGELKHNYEPFEHKIPWDKNYSLQCDGQTLICRNKKGISYVLMLKDLASCYLYKVPDGDAADSYYLTLYMQDGQQKEIPVCDGSDGFHLYMKILNCAPQLVYRFPKQEETIKEVVR